MSNPQHMNFDTGDTPLPDIIILAVCATLGNANGWADIERFGNAKIDFFRAFLELPNGIPSHDTFGRVFALLEPAALMACIQQWLDALGDARAAEDRSHRLPVAHRAVRRSGCPVPVRAFE